MKDKNRLLLDEVIEKEIQEISALNIGADDRADLIEELNQLYKLRIEEAKIEQARLEKYEEKEMKQAQLKSQSLDRWVNIGLQVGLTLASLIAYNIWFNRGLKFEETGTVASPMTRNLMSKMLPRK